MSEICRSDFNRDGAAVPIAAKATPTAFAQFTMTRCTTDQSFPNRVRELPNPSISLPLAAGMLPSSVQGRIYSE